MEYWSLVLGTHRRERGSWSVPATKAFRTLGVMPALNWTGSATGEDDTKLEMYTQIIKMQLGFVDMFWTNWTKKPVFQVQKGEDQTNLKWWWWQWGTALKIGIFAIPDTGSQTEHYYWTTCMHDTICRMRRHSFHREASNLGRNTRERTGGGENENVHNEKVLSSFSPFSISGFRLVRTPPYFPSSTWSP